MRYVVNRVLQAVVTLLIVSVVIFVGVRSIPGDPVLTLAGSDATPETIESIRRSYGLDEGVWTQYVSYMGQVLRGNLGKSMHSNTEVVAMIRNALPVTIELAVLALSVAVVIGVVTGVVAAYRRGTPLEWASNGVALVGMSIPSFWLGLMAILVFSIKIPILPASGFVPISQGLWQNLRHMIMPATILGTGLAAVVMRQTRSAVLDSLTADHVRTAHSKGLSAWRVMTAHVIRNSMLVVVTVLGLQLGFLISGAVVTEQIFVIPGFGKLMMSAVNQRDYPVIQGVVLASAVGYLVINLVVDLLYSVIDPRVRLAGRS